MKAYGSCTPGGPLSIRGIPILVDPTVHHEHPTPPPRGKRTPTPARRVGTPLTREQKAAIVAQRAEGIPAITLALRFGISPSTVFKVLANARRAA